MLESHPKSLPYFFGTEMWERYGFYVVQTLLALYLAMHFGWHDKKIYALVSSFTALTYLSPLIGGWIADKLIGQKAAIIIGCVVLFLSYLLLALIDNHIALTSSLAAIAVGTGLLKPNISSLLGNEYQDGSSKREAGFTIFYMGITSGIILGTTLPSQLNFLFGWSAAFLSAAFGLVLALIIFITGIYMIDIKNYNHGHKSYSRLILAFFMMLLLWLFSFFILNYPRFADMTFLVVITAATTYVIIAMRSESKRQAKLTLIIALLCIISVIFWAFYFQMFTSLTLYITRIVEPEVFGFRFPAPYYVTVQSIGMIIIGLMLVKNRLQSGIVAKTRSIARKFLSAMVLIAITYGLISAVTSLSPVTSFISPFLIMPAFLLLSLAELLLSPVGLSAITLLASRDKVSTMMGIFFVSLGVGAFLSGKLANITAIPEGMIELSKVHLYYAHSFQIMFFILLFLAICCAGLYGLIDHTLKRLPEKA